MTFEQEKRCLAHSKNFIKRQGYTMNDVRLVKRGNKFLVIAKRTVEVRQSNIKNV